MRCRAARRALLERSLGTGPGPAVAAALGKHLGACPACALEARLGERLTAELARLRTEVAFDLDVVERVLTRIPRMAPVAHDQVPFGRVGLLVAGTAACAAALLWTGTVHAPVLFFGMRRLATTAAAISTALLELLRPARTVLGAGLHLALHVWNLVLPLLQNVSGLAPSFEALTLACVAVMTLTTALVVRRDLRRTSQSLAEKEP